jgi:hypothetical protein
LAALDAIEATSPFAQETPEKVFRDIFIFDVSSLDGFL